MKKKFFKYALLMVSVCTLSATVVSCGDDKNDVNNPIIDPSQASDLDYSSAYAEQWANYMVTVSNLLKEDANTLYNQWNNGYANTFKNHNTTEYKSAIDCVDVSTLQVRLATPRLATHTANTLPAIKPKHSMP